MRTKADLKARREGLGMSQSLMAELLGVRTMTVKRWENPNTEWTAPEDAWKLLENFEQKQQDVVEAAFDIVAEQAEELGELPSVINLTYWRDAESYEREHPGEGKFWQMANANSRLIAFVLEQDVYTVEFNFKGLNNLIES